MTGLLVIDPPSVRFEIWMAILSCMSAERSDGSKDKKATH